MAKTLEELIADLAKRGQISHISLSPTHSDKKRLRWQANYRDNLTTGYRIEIDDDPVVALRRVLLPPVIARRDAAHAASLKLMERTSTAKQTAPAAKPRVQRERL